MDRLRIIGFAYACDPTEGSEPGAGWAWSRMLALHADTWIVTRSNNRSAIDAALERLPPAERPRFTYVDLPRWAMAWKRGPRGFRAYYLCWQVLALRRARALHRERSFDVTWHVTLANVWLGSLSALTGTKFFVYGPVGGGVGTAWRLLPALGFRGAVLELLRCLVRAFARYLNPLSRIAWRRADVILAQNWETIDWLPEGHRKKALMLPNVALDQSDLQPRHQRPVNGSGSQKVALIASALRPLKGIGLAIRAMQELPDWHLLICGAGPDGKRLRRLSARIGLEGRVVFLGRQPRDRVLEIMRTEADLLLLPSLHDEAGWVVVEALASGLPVVCLARGGPPILGGHGVPATSIARTTSALVAAILDPRPAEFPMNFTLDTVGERVRTILANLVPPPALSDRSR
jgi:glycosyltransferase involved in cell wall biosynthesis